MKQRIKCSLGETRLRGSAIKKVKNYYQEVAWGSLSSILDHVILWWSREALATHHSHGAQHLKDWLRQFIQGNESNDVFLYLKTLLTFNKLHPSGRVLSYILSKLQHHLRSDQRCRIYVMRSGITRPSLLGTSCLD